MSHFHAGAGYGDLSSSRTRLVQRYINSLEDFDRTFNDLGRNGNEVCLIVIPAAASCCTTLQQVPSGPHVLWQNFGANQGKAEPGAKWCWPAWKQISHLISKQVITYNAKPKSCPTKDSVYVDVDLSINFRIGNTIDQVEKFVQLMGAEQLDAYFFFQTEESIRSLLYDVTHDQVNDLRGNFAINMMSTLQRKVAGFGVEILNVKVTDVQQPRELQDRLQGTTAFKTRILEEEKNHEHQLMQLANGHAQRCAEIKQKFALECQRLVAQKEQYEVQMDEKISVGLSERKVQTENARSKLEVAVMKAKGEIEVADFNGRTKKQELVSSTEIACEKAMRTAQQEAQVQLKNAQAAKETAVVKAQGEIEVAEFQGREQKEKIVRSTAIECERQKRTAEQTAKVEVTSAEASRAASQFLAQARETEAQAAGTAAVQLAEKRYFEQKLKLAEIDAQFARSGRKVLSGDEGKSIMASFCGVRDELKAPRPEAIAGRR